MALKLNFIFISYDNKRRLQFTVKMNDWLLHINNSLSKKFNEDCVVLIRLIPGASLRTDGVQKRGGAFTVSIRPRQIWRLVSVPSTCQQQRQPWARPGGPRCVTSVSLSHPPPPPFPSFPVHVCPSSARASSFLHASPQHTTTLLGVNPQEHNKNHVPDLLHSKLFC